jgi:hypothetical protein
MRIRGVCGRMAGLVAGVMAMQGAWAQPYLGIGVASLSLDSQYASIDGRSGTGITLYGGYEFVPTWSVELSVSAADIDAGPTVNIFYPADSAEYSILRVSMRKSLWTLRERGWTPWVAAGSAYHYVNWDTFYYQLGGTASPRAIPTAKVRSAPGRTSCRRPRCTCFAERGHGRRRATSRARARGAGQATREVAYPSALPSK